MVGKASYLSLLLWPLVKLLGSKWLTQMWVKADQSSFGIFRCVFTSDFSKKTPFLDEQKLHDFIAASENVHIFEGGLIEASRDTYGKRVLWDLHHNGPIAAKNSFLSLMFLRRIFS